MRKAKVFSHETIMPRMSWSSRNLYNMIARSTVPFHASQTTFTKTSLTMYQQRWRSKRFLRAYHGDWIPEKRFKRWFLPTELPSFVPPQVSASSGSSSSSNAGPRKGGLFDKALQARRAPIGPAAEAGSSYAAVTQQKVIEEMDPMPTASLFMRDVERRLDVVVFRSCFARSAYESRGMVVQGKVKVNGVKCNNPNQLLQPGDLVSVEPSAVPMLSKALAEKAKSQKVNDAVVGEAEATEAAQAAEAEADAAAPAEAEGKEGESAAAATKSSSSSSSEAAATDSTDSTKDTTSPASSKGKEKEKTLPPGVHPFTLPDYAAPFLFIPPYLEVSFTTCSVIYVRHPTIVPYKTFSPVDNKARWTFRTDLPSPYPAGGELYSMAWEHYTRNAPRTRADARRTKLEAEVGRNGFESQRAKDQNMKRSALRRGWGRTKQVSGWRGHLAAAQTQVAKQAKKSNNKKEARVVA